MRRVETNTANEARRTDHLAEPGGSDTGAQRIWEGDMRVEPLKSESWHLDKRVPVSLIAAMLMQSATFVWWAATTSSRIDAIEKQMDSMAWQAEKIIRIEERTNNIQSTVTEMRDILRQNYREGGRLAPPN